MKINMSAIDTQIAYSFNRLILRSLTKLYRRWFCKKYLLAALPRAKLFFYKIVAEDEPFHKAKAPKPPKKTKTHFFFEKNNDHSFLKRGVNNLN